jgi:hypothetical protein
MRRGWRTLPDDRALANGLQSGVVGLREGVQSLGESLVAARQACLGLAILGVAATPSKWSANADGTRKQQGRTWH